MLRISSLLLEELYCVFTADSSTTELLPNIQLYSDILAKLGDFINTALVAGNLGFCLGT
jgi:hypothetical protein